MSIVASKVGVKTRRQSKQSKLEGAANKLFESTDLTAALHNSSCKDAARACLVHKGLCTEDWWKRSFSIHFPQLRPYDSLTWKENFKLACGFGFQDSDPQDASVKMYERIWEEPFDEWADDLLLRHSDIDQIIFDVLKPACFLFCQNDGTSEVVIRAEPELSDTRPAFQTPERWVLKVVINGGLFSDLGRPKRHWSKPDF
jgi:hypothetical protein